jgi:hypothetical protein
VREITKCGAKRITSINVEEEYFNREHLNTIELNAKMIKFIKVE